MPYLFFSKCSRILNYFLLNIQNLLIQEKTIATTQVQAFVVIQKISKIGNFTCNYLKNYKDSENAVKSKRCSIFHELSEKIHKMATFFSDQTGSLKGYECIKRKILMEKCFHIPLAPPPPIS